MTVWILDWIENRRKYTKNTTNRC